MWGKYNITTPKIPILIPMLFIYITMFGNEPKSIASHNIYYAVVLN